MLLAAALLPMGASAQTSRLNFEDIDAAKPYKTVSLDDGNGFKVEAVTDRDNSAVEDASANFAFSAGDDDAEWSAKKRWKPDTGLNKSGRSMTISVPKAGNLNIYVRNASGTDATRTLTLTQAGSNIYSEVVKDADQFKLTSNNKTCFPIVSVAVAAGDITVVTSGGINFYGFSFTPTAPASADVTITGAGYATFANNTVGTLSLPEGVQAFGVSAAGESGVTFAEYDVVPAGVGVILKGAAGSYTLQPTDAESSYSGTNMLVAVTADMTVPEKSNGCVNYIFADKSQGVGFYKSSGTGTISKGKAYLAVPDLSADNRSWDFTASKLWSDATIANLEAERALAAAWKSNAEKLDEESGITYYRYMNYSLSTTEAAELTANGEKIAELEGLLFRGNTNRVGIDNRTPNHLYLAGTNVFVVIPDLKAGSTVTISTKSSGSGTNYAYVTCDSENVDRDGPTEALEADNVFTINAFGSYEFQPNRGLYINSITVEYPAAAEAPAFMALPGGNATGVNMVSGQGLMADGYYNLQGQRVHQPRKGLYIVNGKKVVLK